MKFFAILSFTSVFYFSSITVNAQACTLTCPANIVVKADSTKEGATVNFPPAAISGDCGAVTYSRVSGSFFRIGSHSVVATSATGQSVYSLLLLHIMNPFYYHPLHFLQKNCGRQIIR